jgi:hypothetical protein
MTKEQKEPAFPCTPLQDNFGRLVVPVAGMSKYELVFKDILCDIIASSNTSFEFADVIVYKAKKYTDLYFEHLNKHNEPDTTTKPTFTIH